ncbi:MAG: preprotein translocase subunit SecY [bacterium]
MLEKIIQIWRIKDLRNSILFVALMLVIFRIAAHIPIPGVDTNGLKELFANNQLLGLINIFSGGSMDKLSIVMLGVAPYITSSIIFQLLTMVVPSLEELSKDGESGRKKINQWTRLASIPLAALQAFSMITLLRQSSGYVMLNLDAWQWVMAITTVTAGTVFLMWLGELMTEKKIGNGISLLIFAGIVSGLPGLILRTLTTLDKTQIINMAVFAVIALVTIAAIVFITEGQRNVPVSYARNVRGGRALGSGNSFLPIRVNQAGVIPIIFAVSIIIFPQAIARLFANAHTPWVKDTAAWVLHTLSNQGVYGVFYFLLVVLFTYFYTAVIFHPDRVSENMQKNGGFIPGIRPGTHTAHYLQSVVNRVTLAGALFLGIVAVLPLITAQITHTQALVVGGTSLLIVVSVVIESIKQINSQLEMRDYDQIV